MTIASYAAGGRHLLHPDYMERLGVAGLMRYPGLSKDPWMPSAVCART